MPIPHPPLVDLRRGASPAEWADWRWQTRHRVRTVAALRDALGLPGAGTPDAARVEERFPVGVTPYYLSLVRPDDPADPILRQILPSDEEAHATGQEVDDPFREEERSPVPGVVHRYPDRALILPTNFCATLCRHCFRKRSWAEGFHVLDRAALRRAVDYVRGEPGIRDVIVTGGDPLHLPTGSLERLLEDLRSVPHLEVLRIASRTPVTLPQRLDDALVDVLRRARPLWFVTHFNHAREVSPDAASTLRRLIDAGITVQNQAVLLRGVNDSTEAQVALSRALLRLGVRPYYLHLADPVAGAGHFRVSLADAVAVLKGMFGRVAGFGVPRLVVDLPGGGGKVPLEPDFVVRRSGDDVWFESPIDGGEVRFTDPGDRS